MSTPYTVSVRGLRKSFGDHVVLDGVDLAVPAGRVYALLGPNGAGKTTLVRVLSTLSPPDAGEVRVAGHDVVADPVAVKRAISLTGQFTAVDDLLTGAENLRMLGRLHGLGARAARARADDLLAVFDLADAAGGRVAAYSGGMRRRLDLALSLVVRPEVLFLDEPSTGLDPRSRQALWRIVEDLRDDGTTVLLTTQYLEEADALADRVGVIAGGRLVAEGTADELKAAVGVEVVELTFPSAASFAAARARLPAAESDAAARHLRVPTDGSAAHVRGLLDDLAAAGAGEARVGVRRPSLDDVFLTLTGAASAPDRSSTPKALTA